jgi:hypothetical protein
MSVDSKKRNRTEGIVKKGQEGLSCQQRMRDVGQGQVVKTSNETRSQDGIELLFL